MHRRESRMRMSRLSANPPRPSSILRHQTIRPVPAIWARLPLRHFRAITQPRHIVQLSASPWTGRRRVNGDRQGVGVDA